MPRSGNESDRPVGCPRGILGRRVAKTIVIRSQSRHGPRHEVDVIEGVCLVGALTDDCAAIGRGRHFSAASPEGAMTATNRHHLQLRRLRLLAISGEREPLAVSEPDRWAVCVACKRRDPAGTRQHHRRAAVPFGKKRKLKPSARLTSPGASAAQCDDEADSGYQR